MRRSYTVKVKLDALEKLRENNGNISLTARDIGITNKMLRDWRNNERSLTDSKFKTTVRKLGSRANPEWPILEERLKDWVKEARSKYKRIVSYSCLREKAQEIANDLNILEFKGSNNWINKFMERNGFSSRKITSFGQEDNRDPSIIKSIVNEYLETLASKRACLLEGEEVYNMDETPVHIDMMSTRTISFKGEKNTEVHTTGNQKTRMTVVLTVNSAGKMLKGLVIVKGLKKVPKCRIPHNIAVTVSKSGTMDKYLMQEWIRMCFNETGPFIQRQKKLLLLDAFGSHFDENVVKAKYNENRFIANSTENNIISSTS